LGKETERTAANAQKQPQNADNDEANAEREGNILFIYLFTHKALGQLKSN